MNLANESAAKFAVRYRGRRVMMEEIGEGKIDSSVVGRSFWNIETLFRGSDGRWYLRKFHHYHLDRAGCAAVNHQVKRWRAFPESMRPGGTAAEFRRFAVLENAIPIFAFRRIQRGSVPFWVNRMVPGENEKNMILAKIDSTRKQGVR